MALPPVSLGEIKVGDLVVLGTKEGWEENPIGIVVSITGKTNSPALKTIVREYEVCLISKRGKSIKLYFTAEDLVVLSRAKINKNCKNEKKDLHPLEPYDKILEDIANKGSNFDEED